MTGDSDESDDEGRKRYNQESESVVLPVFSGVSLMTSDDNDEEGKNAISRPSLPCSYRASPAIQAIQTEHHTLDIHIHSIKAIGFR